jgi:hypothetical protein
MSGPPPSHAEDGRLRILLIDNFDSYSYNLYHGLAMAGCQVPWAPLVACSLAPMQRVKPGQPNRAAVPVLRATPSFTRCCPAGDRGQE